MEAQTNKNNIYTLYSNAQSDEEKIEIVADYIFQLSKENTNEKDDLIDEEIDDLYFEIISKLRKEIIKENSNIFKYKLYKAYGLPSKENYKEDELDFYITDLVRMQLKIKEQEKKLSVIDRGVILSNLEFKEFHKGDGIVYNKKKIGYNVFLKFKKLWKFKIVQLEEPEPLTKKQIQKIGLLIRSGIIDFIKEKNPKITTNQIAGFIDLLSKEPLKQTLINSNLSKENKNYPIKNQQDKKDLDYILEKYGISPQSE